MISLTETTLERESSFSFRPFQLPSLFLQHFGHHLIFPVQLSLKGAFTQKWKLLRIPPWYWIIEPHQQKFRKVLSFAKEIIQKNLRNIFALSPRTMLLLSGQGRVFQKDVLGFRTLDITFEGLYWPYYSVTTYESEHYSFLVNTPFNVSLATDSSLCLCSR